MDTTVEDTPHSFDLDAILKEFNVDTPAAPQVSKEDESTVARVRESLGLGRSLFRRKQSPIDKAEEPADDDDEEETSEDREHTVSEKAAKQRKRIVASDDEDDLLITIPVHRSSSVVSAAPDEFDDISPNEDNDTPGSPMSDDDLPSHESIIADFRKAR